MLENARNARKCQNGRKVKLDAGKFFPNVVYLKSVEDSIKILNIYIACFSFSNLLSLRLGIYY